MKASKTTTAEASTVVEIIRALKPGAWGALGAVKPVGSVVARKQADGGVMLFWRYAVDGKQAVRVKIGQYDGTLPTKTMKPVGSRYSLVAAHLAAIAMAVDHEADRASGGQGHGAIVAAKQAAIAAAADAAADAAAHTFVGLMTDYANHLEALGRDAYKDVRSIVKHHIQPTKWASKPAAAILDEDVADIMRTINEAGKLRTANKARSYIRAAFETAKVARTDGSIPSSFKAYKIRSNPAVETRVIKSGKRPVVRALKTDQLRAYWRIIKDVPGVRGDMLRVHLLTGGQRLDQLVRLTVADVEDDVITIHDSKGKPGEGPRPHLLPLIPLAAQALHNCVATQGEFAFTTDNGRTHVSGETLSGWSIDTVNNKIAGFQPKQIRSGVETLLSAAGVPKEVRGRLQSHGISGVQDRNYNAYEFIAEKREALELLAKVVQQPVGTPVSQWRDDRGAPDNKVVALSEHRRA